MAKKKYPLLETINVDSCECVYCGHVFNGNEATNGDLDCQSITCPKCEREMSVSIMATFRCTPME